MEKFHQFPCRSIIERCGKHAIGSVSFLFGSVAFPLFFRARKRREEGSFLYAFIAVRSSVSATFYHPITIGGSNEWCAARAGDDRRFARVLDIKHGPKSEAWRFQRVSAAQRNRESSLTLIFVSSRWLFIVKPLPDTRR